MNLKLEVIIIPVTDVDRAKAFYEKLGFRLDIDYTADEKFRALQFTPPGSSASVIFGKGIIAAKSGSADSLVLAVDDVVAVRKDLKNRGVDISEVFHYAAGPFNNTGDNPRVNGPDPDRRSYYSFASFADPDGNEWILQEITTRLPGRIDSAGTTFNSPNDLASALRRAEAAHGEHEKRTGGGRDANWPEWYANYMAAEQAGTELPQ